jgi:hypothetical protein
MKCCTGTVQRIASSTRPGISDGLARSFSSSPGCSHNAHIAPHVDDDVVSCPAAAMMM